jgi:hypothetical protein
VGDKRAGLGHGDLRYWYQSHEKTIPGSKLAKKLQKVRVKH